VIYKLTDSMLVFNRAVCMEFVEVRLVPKSKLLRTLVPELV